MIRRYSSVLSVLGALALLLNISCQYHSIEQQPLDGGTDGGTDDGTDDGTDGRDGSSGGDQSVGEWLGSCVKGTRLARQTAEYSEDCCIFDHCFDDLNVYSQDLCYDAAVPVGIGTSSCYQSPCDDYSCDDGFEVQQIGGPLTCIHNNGAFVEGVFRTTNGGRSWEPFSKGFSDLLPNQPLVAELGGADDYILAVDPTQPGVVYLGSPEGFFAAQEDGNEWEKLLSGDVHRLYVNTSTGRIHLALYDRGDGYHYTYHSSDDGGRSWSSKGGIAASGYIRIGVNDIISSPSDDDVLMIAVITSGSGGQVSNVFVSRDNGGSWADVSTPGIEDGSGRAWSLALDKDSGGERIYVANGDSRFFRSDGFGPSWTELPESPDGRCRVFLSVDPCQPGQVLCGTEIYKSTLWVYDEGSGLWTEHEDLRKYWSNAMTYTGDCSSKYAYRLEGHLGVVGDYHTVPGEGVQPSDDFGVPDCGEQVEFARMDVGNLVQASHGGSPWKPAIKGLPYLRGSSCLSVRMHSLAVSRNNPLVAFAVFALSQDCIYD